MRPEPRTPEDLAALGAPSDNDSLTSVLRELAADGFRSSYRPAVDRPAAVVCGACGQGIPVADLAVAFERRLEGASEPDEMVLVIAADCPACQTGGAIVLGYGPEASPEDADIVAALQQQPAEPGRGRASADRAAAGGEASPAPTPRDPSGLGRIGAAIDRADALDAAADPIHRTIDAHLPVRVRSLLQGRWLGHPLHPVLTDLTIGFWTSAWLLDLLGDERTDDVADAFVAAGLVAAVPTAWSGWSDWIELPREKRRSGLVHAASNATAIGLYGASLMARRRGARSLGVGLGHAAAGVATFGGFLGGHLAFGG